MTGVEEACLSLEHYEADELRVEIRGALKYSHHPMPNIAEEEMKALKELR